jgi:Domain of unknown function (DUF4034)
MKQPYKHLGAAAVAAGHAAALTVALFFSGLAQAQIVVSAPPLDDPNADVTCSDLDLQKKVPCPDSYMPQYTGQLPVMDAFVNKNFVELDRLFDTWCTGADRFPDGRWKLSQYVEGLAQSFQGWNRWSKDLDTIKEWQKARPNSSAAQYAEAVYWRAYAWKARGEGYTSTVSKEGWALFKERLQTAESILAAPQIKAAHCPAPEVLKIHVLTDLGASEAQLLSAYSAAASKYSQYHNIHFAMARHYEPKWGGSLKKYEAFADQVAQQTKAFEGMGMYARLYWVVDYHGGTPFTNNPKAPPTWKKLKAGYEDLMRLYPSSIHNINKYAGVACRSTEGALYRRLRDKIVGFEQPEEMVDPIDVCDLRHQWAPKGKK